MKKYSNILFLVAVLFLSSCSKFLDQVPDDILTTDEIFQSRENTDKFLANIYNAVPNEFSQRFVVNENSGTWTGSSDEAKYNWDFNYGGRLNNSTWTYTDGEVAAFWRNYYRAIRNATFFIKNIDNANPAEVNEEIRRVYKAEARALRALYYFYLVRLYGPVIIIGEDMLDFEAPAEALQVPRNTMEECINFITTEFDAAYADLGNQPLSQQWGRMTRGVCKAYKAEALHLAASPLFNGNPNYANMKNPDGTQLISSTYDQNKWKQSADAAKAFIDEFVPTVYDLYVETNGNPFMQAYLSCKNVVLQDWNKEWIFGRTRSTNYSQYDRTPKHVGFPSQTQGGGALGVTQTMVDAYYMANGLPITDPASGYVETGFSDYQAPFDVQARSTFNQWVNREPRFYVGVTYNRSYWLNQYSSPTPVITIMEFSGNSGRIQSTSDVTPTGYIVRKNVALNGNNRGVVLLRLANVYLNYAEALNEYDPGNTDILKYLNLVRKRAGIPEFGNDPGQIPAPAGQAAMREAIRAERRVELAFENVRYFDTRRWLISEQTNNGPFYGMNLAANGNAFYEKTVLEVRTFQQRDYLWPIPNNEVLKDPNMVQNTGW